MHRSSNDAAPARSDVGRLPALDGLRGVAALMVLVYHVLLIDRAVAAVVQREAAADGVLWWFTHTPLRLLWLGQEAVVVFFVLSGFVLTLPFTRTDGPAPAWRSFYPQRILRLYLPVAASVALAVGTYLLVDHSVRPGASFWMAGHDIDLTPARVLDALSPLPGDTWVNTVLWSLRLELLFSLVLPAYVLLLSRLPRGAGRVLTVCAVGTVGFAVVGSSTPAYAGAFFVGVTLCVSRARVGTVLARCGGLAWTALLLLAGALLMATWWPGVGIVLLAGGAGFALVTLGAAIVVAAAVWCPGVSRALRVRPVGWLGRRSFSLYLVHEPLVVLTALLLPTAGLAVQMAVAVPVTLVVAAGFHRVVERPSHLLARRVGRVAAGPGARQPAPLTSG